MNYLTLQIKFVVLSVLPADTFRGTISGQGTGSVYTEWFSKKDKQSANQSVPGKCVRAWAPPRFMNHSSSVQSAVSDKAA